MTRGEMMARMSAREFDQWIAYDRVEPIGEWRADIRNAMLMTLLANVHRDPKRRPFKLDQFLPFVPKHAPTADELEERFRAIVGLPVDEEREEDEAWPPSPGS
jgi:hypothetical protein